MLRCAAGSRDPLAPLWLRACYYSTVVRFGFDSTAVRLLISKLVKVTATNSASRSRADLFVLLERSAAARET